MKKLFLLICSIAPFFLNGTLPPPYNAINPLPFNAQGWYINGPSMEWLLKETKAKVVIEVGSWLGSSTRHIASTIPEDGVVYAIDHWLGTPTEDTSAFDMPNLYLQFLSNVIHARLTHKIVPIRMSSAEAAASFNIRPDLVYIDATHDYEDVYQDITL